MRQLVGVFSELEASSAHPMPRPFKLEAYVDPAESTGRSAATLMKVVCVGCGIAGGGPAPRVSFSLPNPVADAGSGWRAPRVAPPVWTTLAAAAGPAPATASMPGRRSVPVSLEPGGLPPVEAQRPSAGASRSDVAPSSTARSVAARSRVGAKPRTYAGTPIIPPSPANLSRQTASSGMVVQRSTPVALAPDDTVQVAAPSVDADRFAEDVARPAFAGCGVVDPEVGSASSVERTGAPTQTERGVEFSVATRFNGVTAGRISLLLEGSTLGHPDRVSDNISVRLGDIIALLGPRMDPALLDRLGSSEHAERYLTLNDLRANGILVSFDAKDRLVFRAM